LVSHVYKQLLQSESWWTGSVGKLRGITLKKIQAESGTGERGLIALFWHASLIKQVFLFPSPGPKFAPGDSLRMLTGDRQARLPLTCCPQATTTAQSPSANSALLFAVVFLSAKIDCES